MALKTFVKISNVSNLSNARYCAGMMVDILGFDIDPTSEKQISLEEYRELTEWVSGVQFAGEFSTSDVDKVIKAIGEYPVDFIEVRDMAIIDALQNAGKPLILKTEITSNAGVAGFSGLMGTLEGKVEAVIVKTDAEAHFQSLDDIIMDYSGPLQLIKGFGLNNLESLASFAGLELEGTEEERPGYQDYGEVMDVLEALETED